MRGKRSPETNIWRRLSPPRAKSGPEGPCRSRCGPPSNQLLRQRCQSLRIARPTQRKRFNRSPYAWSARHQRKRPPFISGLEAGLGIDNNVEGHQLMYLKSSIDAPSVSANVSVVVVLLYPVMLYVLWCGTGCEKTLSNWNVGVGRCRIKFVGESGSAGVYVSLEALPTGMSGHGRYVQHVPPTVRQRR